MIDNDDIFAGLEQEDYDYIAGGSAKTKRAKSEKPRRRNGLFWRDFYKRL